MDGDDHESPDWRHAMGRRMDGFEQRLDENTAATMRVEKNTSDIVNIFNSWKGAMQVIEMLGRVAKPLAAIVALIAAYFTFKPGK